VEFVASLPEDDLRQDWRAKRMVAPLLRKIGAANRVEAVALAGRSGLLDDIPDSSSV
jgi:hypothetical protein